MPGVMMKELSKRYGEVGAVQGLSLSVEPGELLALLGPSGCGKTTTLRLVAGFLAPEAGEIWVGDRCLSTPTSVVPPERRRMAMIFQSYALWPHMTVAQNVAYGLRFKPGLSRGDREARVRQMLRGVQLAGYETRYPGELSGGQQQRVAVARALVVEPEILLLDEPLSNLDANLREEMRFEIRRLHETFGNTTLYVTHDQGEAMVISDRIAVLKAGKVAQTGTADDLYHRPRTRFVAEFIGRTNVVDGVAVARDTVAHANVRIRVAIADLAPGSRVALSIRPHQLPRRVDHRRRSVHDGRRRRVHDGRRRRVHDGRGRRVHDRWGGRVDDRRCGRDDDGGTAEDSDTAEDLVEDGESAEAEGGIGG